MESKFHPIYICMKSRHCTANIYINDLSFQQWHCPRGFPDLFFHVPCESKGKQKAKWNQWTWWIVAISIIFIRIQVALSRHTGLRSTQDAHIGGLPSLPSPRPRRSRRSADTRSRISERRCRWRHSCLCYHIRDSAFVYVANVYMRSRACKQSAVARYF